MTSAISRAGRAESTREQILDTAERLFAEHGVHAVSNRQISQEAGQGNNAAVGYHFGTKTDLVRAIARRHAEPIEEIRARYVAERAGSDDVRDWVTCLVRPVPDHLAALGEPTWFARFGAQVMTDPVMREIMVAESGSSPSLRRIVVSIRACVPDLDAAVRSERNDMARQLMVHMCAERERALAEGTPTPRASWDEAGAGLADAIVGILTAPVS